MEQTNKVARFTPSSKKKPQYVDNEHARNFDDEDEEDDYNDKRGLEDIKKSVTPMKKRGAPQMDPQTQLRYEKFMSHYAGTTKRTKKEVEKEQEEEQEQKYPDNMYMEPSSGRLTSTGVIVDDISRKFGQGDAQHLMSMMPPASSTPTTEELAGGWGALQNRQQKEAEFYADPVVQFFLAVDGFLDNNTIVKKTVENKQNMKVTDVYQLLAGQQAQGGGRYGPGGILPTGRTTIRTFQIGGGGNAGLPNVGSARGADTSVRVTDDSVDDAFTRNIRLGEQEVRAQILRGNAPRTPLVTPIRPQGGGRNNIPDIQFDPDVFSPYSNGEDPLATSTPGRGVTFGTPSQSRKINKYQMEPSAPSAKDLARRGEGDEPGRLETARPVPFSITGDEDVGEMARREDEEREQQARRMSSGVNQGETNQPSGGGVGNAAPQNRDEALYRISRDPANIPVVNKYLSDLRTIQAYESMNRPEITGTLPLSSAVLAAVYLAYDQLMESYGHNFAGAELMDFITNKSISNWFAFYVALVKLYNTSQAMNKVVLQVTQPRLLNSRIGLEQSVFSKKRWNRTRRVFEDVSKSGGGYARPSSFRNNFQRLYGEQNEMFNYSS